MDNFCIIFLEKPRYYPDSLILETRWLADNGSNDIGSDDADPRYCH